MAEHRTDALQVFGVMPEITKLYGDRYALTFRCNPSDNTEGWYYDNKDNIFADFGTLMDAGFGDSPATPNPDSTWPNQRLVRHRLEYPQGQDTPVVVFEYETLTDSFVQEAADKVDYELNGLRRVTRSVIAKDGTSYGKTVGTSTIEHTEHGYPTLTLTLASAIQDQEQPSESGSVRIIETWVQQGKLAESVTVESTGLNRRTTTYLVSEDATASPIVSRSTQNINGLPTITVSVLERTDGSVITDGNPTNSFGQMFNFKYPGIVGVSSVVTTSTFGDNAINRFFYQRSPVDRPIPAKSYVFFQTSADPVAGDYVYDGASGLWSPSNWAQGTYYGWRYQRDGFGTPIGESPGFRGFRVAEAAEIAGVTTSASGVATDDDGLSGTLLLNGTTWSISVSGGPEKPDGNKYTLGVIDIQPAFVDVDGTQYYKKVITVATIPTQSGSTIT